MIIYRDVTVIDGTGAPARGGLSVAVDGPLISGVGPLDELVIDDADEVVDLPGRFLLPGLIDTHQHLATPPDRQFAESMMRRDLYSGITAVRVMADDLRLIADLARCVMVGELPGPDIYYAALMAGPSFFDDPRTIEVTQGAISGDAPWMQAITDDTDLQLAVARAAGTSATAIKIYANLPRHLVEAITAEAHRQGLLVWAHGMVFPTTPVEGIEAGVDSVSHVCMLAYQVMKERPSAYARRAPIEHEKFQNGDTAALTALFEQMRERGTILDATTWLYRKSDADAEIAARLTAQAFRAGVLISTGTDGFTPPEDPFPALHQELELLNEKAGMPAMQVIRSATSIGAAAIGQQDTMGTIEAGKLANFVVVAENPLQQISNLRSVVFTVKRGCRYDRVDYSHG